jgi:predicted nucleic acid-binding protein
MPNATISCFVDTNILVYSADPEAAEKQLIAQDLLRSLVSSGVLVLSPQSLNECYRALTRTQRRIATNQIARAYVETYAGFCTAPYDLAVTQLAWGIQDEYLFSWWDCVLLGSATLAGCSIFFSEDLQHHRQIGSLTIVNPFV